MEIPGHEFHALGLSRNGPTRLFPAGAVHDAFVHIRALFKGATQELFVIDGYVDPTIFTFLLSTNGPRTCRILTDTRSLPADFVQEATLFAKQHSFTISIRTNRDFHDRQIIADGRDVFFLGASIKDAGKRAFNIVPVNTPELKTKVIAYAERVWAKAATVL